MDEPDSWFRLAGYLAIFSEREFTFTFAICRRLSVTFVHPTQAIEIFGNVSSCCTLLTQQEF